MNRISEINKQAEIAVGYREHDLNRLAIYGKEVAEYIFDNNRLVGYILSRLEIAENALIVALTELKSMDMTLENDRSTGDWPDNDAIVKVNQALKQICEE